MLQAFSKFRHFVKYLHFNCNRLSFIQANPLQNYKLIWIITNLFLSKKSMTYLPLKANKKQLVNKKKVLCFLSFILIYYFKISIVNFVLLTKQFVLLPFGQNNHKFILVSEIQNEYVLNVVSQKNYTSYDIQPFPAGFYTPVKIITPSK